MFTFCRFTKATRTYIPPPGPVSGRFFQRLSSVAGEKKGQECRGPRGFLFSGSLGWKRGDADTLRERISTLLSRFSNGEGRKSERIFLSCATCMYTPGFEVVAFFFTCSWRMRKNLAKKASSPALFSFSSSYLQAGYFFVGVASTALRISPTAIFVTSRLICVLIKNSQLRER